MHCMDSGTGILLGVLISSGVSLLIGERQRKGQAKEVALLHEERVVLRHLDQEARRDDRLWDARRLAYTEILRAFDDWGSAIVRDLERVKARSQAKPSPFEVTVVELGPENTAASVAVAATRVLGGRAVREFAEEAYGHLLAVHQEALRGATAAAKHDKYEVARESLIEAMAAELGPDMA